MGLRYIAYANSNDYSINSNSTVSYATARNGTGTLTVGSTTATNYSIGQGFSGSQYNVFQAYLSFDTSAWSSYSSSMVDFNIRTNAKGSSSTPFTVLLYAWTAGAGASNFVAGGSLGSLTSLATGNTGAIGAYNSPATLSSWSATSTFNVVIVAPSSITNTAPTDNTTTSIIESGDNTSFRPYLGLTILGTVTTKTITSSTTLTIGGAGANDPPAGVTEIQGECWGAGGGGGGGKGAGGSGGAYSLLTFPVTTGTLAIVVGTGGTAGTATTGGNGGGPSSVTYNGAQQTIANPGNGGATAGGTTAAPAVTFSQTSYAGGSGGAGGGGGTQGGGSGGGGAGSAGAGGNGPSNATATSTTRPAAGTAGSPDGGAGGQGGAKVTTAGTGTAGGTGLAGSFPGGGGGGGSASQAGGAGANGLVKISWIAPTTRRQPARSAFFFR